MGRGRGGRGGPEAGGAGLSQGGVGAGGAGQGGARWGRRKGTRASFRLLRRQITRSRAALRLEKSDSVQSLTGSPWSRTH